MSSMPFANGKFNFRMSKELLYYLISNFTYRVCLSVLVLICLIKNVRLISRTNYHILVAFIHSLNLIYGGKSSQKEFIILSFSRSLGMLR